MARGHHINLRSSSRLRDLRRVDNPIHATPVAETALKSNKAKIQTQPKLPEKYEVLAKFFNCMLSSIRLLRLKGMRSTFTNISPQIEILTERRFSHCHLAQIKYVLPEAISIKKILVRDKRTLCTRPDLHIALDINAFNNVQNQKFDSGYSILKKTFHARLLDFLKTHAEGGEIPEETLPEPFNRTKPDELIPAQIRQKSLAGSFDQTKGIVIPSHQNINVSQLSATSLDTPLQRASHMSQSFQRRFSVRTVAESEVAVLNPLASPVKPMLPATMPHQPPNAYAVQSPINCSSKPSEAKISDASDYVKLPLSSILQSHEKERKPTENEACIPSEMDGIEGTPLKMVFSPSRLMTSTPDVQTSKRCRMSPDTDAASSNKAMTRSTRIRSLKFHTPIKDSKSRVKHIESNTSSADAEIINILPEALLQSVREKEKKAMEAKKRKQQIACLPKLFDMIHLTFQSMGRSVMTKQELMYKIIVNRFDIVHKEEIEGQIKLLQELAPDWISEKISSSGDSLLCVNKSSIPESIHARLAEVK